jgi:Zn-dependent oligopeptidase
LELKFTNRTSADPEKHPDGLTWKHTAKDIERLGKEIIDESNLAIKKIVNWRGPRTFKNTIEPLNKYESVFNKKSTPIGFYT